MVGAIILFYIAGYLLNWRFDIVNPLKGRVVGWNYLFIHEAVILYTFYLMGVLMRRRRFLRDSGSPRILLPAAIGMFLVVLFTYGLNSGGFSFANLDAVVILLSSHGHVVWFPLTAVAGTLMLMLIARLLRPWRLLLIFGQNTLILMCLNGIFYHYVNPPAAKWVVDHLPGTPFVILLVAILMTLLSLLLCLPLINLLNKWVPQLVGKPRQSGPLLRSLIHKESG